MPKKLHNPKKGPSERIKIAEMRKLLHRMQMNFYCKGKKIRAVTYLEMKLHNQFVKLLIQIKSENEFLFVPLKPTETIDHVDFKKFGKKISESFAKTTWFYQHDHQINPLSKTYGVGVEGKNSQQP